MDIIRENRSYWFYLIGIVILFIIMIVAASIFLRSETPGSTQNEDTQTLPTVFESVPSFILDLDKVYTAQFNTSLGNFNAKLYPVNAPLNVNNFVFLAQRKYYDGLTVHRVEPNVFAQTGSRLTLNDNPNDDIQGNPGYLVNDEINWDSLDLSEAKRKELEKEGYKSNIKVVSKKIEKYSLVMANANQPNSAGSQYFIVLADNSDPRLEFLSGRHTVIGSVITGRDVIDQMRKIDVDISNPEQKRPVTLITINTITINIQ